MNKPRCEVGLGIAQCTEEAAYVCTYRDDNGEHSFLRCKYHRTGNGKVKMTPIDKAQTPPALPDGEQK